MHELSSNGLPLNSHVREFAAYCCRRTAQRKLKKASATVAMTALSVAAGKASDYFSATGRQLLLPTSSANKVKAPVAHGRKEERMPIATTVIIGAGPYGLSLAAYARTAGIDHVLFGEAMGLWKHHMPHGMLLRSDCEWHLDPWERHTILRFLAENRLTRDRVEPLPLDLYLD